MAAKSPLSEPLSDGCLAVLYYAHLFVIALLLPGLAIGESKIYKSRDANGNVVFTDVPPVKGGKALDPIVLKETNTWEGPRTDSANKRTPWIVEKTGDEEPVAFVPYTTLTILDPVNDATVRENSGLVTVTVSLLPPLSAEHQLRLLMDGKVVGQNSGGNFTLESVDRGTHSLLLEVVNAAGQSLQQSSVTTFHLQRYHLPPPKRKPAPTP